jgi:GT2 family glycosyltransferase
MKVSFIIPTYNTLALTKKCLETLQATVDLTNHEVILIDDVSTDGTKEYLQTLSSPFKVIYNSINQGYGRSNNQAAATATGDILCLCNSDLIFLENWFEPMLDTFNRYKAIGFVGNMQRRVDNDWIDHLGVYFLPDGLPLHIAQNKTYVPVRLHLPVSAVTAACCMIRTSLFRQFGGFSEAYLNGFEDTDLCLRLNQAGYQHWVSTRSCVRHHISSSPGRKVKENENLALFIKQWQAVTKVLSEKEASQWEEFHFILQVPQFVRWPLLLQSRLRLF